MFVELLHGSARDRLIRAHQSMTVEALVTLFEYREERAQAAVKDWWRRAEEAPASTLQWLVHEDPVNAAAKIAERPLVTLINHDVPEEKRAGMSLADQLIEPFASRLRDFNANVRPRFEPSLVVDRG
jgi:hypothetical protein